MDALSTNSGGAENRVLNSRVICILWHAQARAVDPELERGLKRWQGLVVTGCRSAPAAIAEVMSLERAMRAGKREATVLLLVEPEKLIGVCDVLCAMDKYAATTRCWCYEPGSSEMLRAVTPKDIARWTRINLDRQRAIRPESTPQVSVVSSVLSQKTQGRAAVPFKPLKAVELSLAETLLEKPAILETTPYVDPEEPHLHLEVDSEPVANPNINGSWKSDNRDSDVSKWGGGLTNVLTPDEMAMLLAEEDGRAHT